ncbi:hypothetical protein EV401DRAFT_1903886 [Pisolithus croceorrhizus]|nr:hypothetical protein EV401DRAFT_1903886 [Pisolithus croceorrhizus]
MSRAMHPLRSVLCGNAFWAGAARCLIRTSSSAANVLHNVHKVSLSESQHTPPPLDVPEADRPLHLNEGTAGVHFYRAEPLPRGTKPTSVQSSFQFLPEVPRIPPGKTMHINHSDIDTYFHPLIRCHWHVGRVRAVARDVETLTLDKLFRFKNFETMLKFFNELAEISLNENHHAHYACDYARIYVSVYTHAAYGNTQGESGQWISELIPGLTLRDVRFAIKAERLHQKYLANGLAITLAPFENERLQDWSIERLKLRYPRQPGVMQGATDRA